MRDMSNLIAAVTMEASVASSAVQALLGLEQHLDDANAQIAVMRQQADANEVDPDQVTKLLDTVSTTTAQLSAAIPANTTPVTTAPLPMATVPGATLLAPVTDTTVQARDAASTTSPVVGFEVPTVTGAFAQPTETASAGLAAGPGPAEVIAQP